MTPDDRVLGLLLDLQASTARTHALLETHVGIITSRLDTHSHQIDEIENKTETSIRRIRYLASFAAIAASAVVWAAEHTDVVTRLWKAI